MDPPPPLYPSPYPPPQFYPPPVVATTIPAVSPTPAISPIAVEVQNNTVPTHVAANPSPPPPNPASNHPPYAEMICAAITALKEKDGSSKRAIAKYIERVYSGLPPTHSALLTHHLKRLKNNGLLVMVKKSYKLPRSDASAPPPTDSAAAAAAAATATAALPSAGPSRGRGRPPKNKPIPDQQPNSQQQFIPIPQQPNFQQQPIPIPQQFPQLIPISQQPILQQPIPIPHQSSPQQPIPQPNFQAFPPAEPTEQPNSQPMLVALGLVDDPSLGKRRPGRPRKAVGGGVGQAVGAGSVSAKRGRGRPPGSRLPKKRPGRPPKVKSVSSAGPNGLVKRGRGRPSKAEPKSVFFPYATNVPLMGAFEQNNVPNVVEAQQPSSRPRGRPRKDPAAAADVRVGGLVPGKRGRPPGLPGIERPSRRTGRPVGRPKKNASVAKNEAPDSKSVDNGEFKRKLEYFQSKVGQAVSALKPYLNHDSTGDVVSAIQELDVLATMDISAPLNVEAQQPVLQN